MASNMPKRTKQHVFRDQAVLLAKRCLPTAWIVRVEGQGNDYGIDLEVELAGTQVTGRLFKAQVKGHHCIPWSAERSYLQPVREETLDYWRALPVPVVLLVADLSADVTYWAFGKVPSGATGVRVMRGITLPKDAPRLASYVIDWIDHRSAKALLYGLPFFADAWASLNEQMDCDCFDAVGPEYYALLHYVYSQTKLIRDALGLTTQMLPWPIWLARARAMFPDLGDLCWGIYDEVVLYLAPLVEETLAIGRQQLQSEEPTSENSAAKAWASGSHMYYIVRTDFDTVGVAFWTRLDEHLRSRGALRMKVAQSLLFRMDQTEKSSRTDGHHESA